MPTDSTKEFYDRIGQAYGLIADASEHDAREAGENALHVRAGDTVLEIGFGTGHSLVAFAKAVGPSGRVYGIDISDGMLEVARQRVGRAGFRERVDLRTGDARSLAFDDEFFDAVFMSFTLEVFSPREIPHVLDEVRRVLRAGGRLGVVALSVDNHPGLLTEFYLWLHRHFPHFIDCRPIDAIDVFTKAGFVIDEKIDMSIWSLSVVAVVAVKQDSAKLA